MYLFSIPALLLCSVLPAFFFISCGDTYYIKGLTRTGNGEGKIYIIPVTVINFNIKMMENMGELECYGMFPEENVIQVSFSFTYIELSFYLDKKVCSDCSDVQSARCSECFKC